ncbi:MAG TPA: carbon storage regulator [Pirellulaceae bacterium]|nr:carbon storage regulator [Pirellulaceae bacterium]HMO92833.1 carbon storage regulator [Pirellulaceae bacterium]HMP69425.1 carbon storage regulator [Pirellulaceae bacterium]
MLVLSRKVNDELIIGDDVRIKVLKIKGNTIRLGIEAPNSVRVARGELADRDSANHEIVTTVEISGQAVVVTGQANTKRYAKSGTGGVNRDQLRNQPHQSKRGTKSSLESCSRS